MAGKGNPSYVCANDFGSSGGVWPDVRADSRRRYGRGRSTPEKRQPTLDSFQDFVANPWGPHAAEKREWVLNWIIEVPDFQVRVCPILDKLPKGDKKDSNAIFTAEVLSQTAFAIQNADKPDDRAGEFRAGVEGGLRIYEGGLIKTNAKDHQPCLDDLVQRRNAGTLDDFVKERSNTSCRN